LYLLCASLEPSWVARLIATSTSNPCPLHIASLSDLRTLGSLISVACIFGFTLREHRRSRRYLRFVTEGWVGRTFDFRRY
jgi:hypothetical protein